MKRNTKWISNFILWFGADGIEIRESHIYNDHDLALIRIDAAHLSSVEAFPRIKNPAAIKAGTSLCKLGFPFIQINASFDEATKAFVFSSNLLPIPRFPIEGIYTRNVVSGKAQDGILDIEYMETSSPGIKGQTGRPIFDVDGNLYALQAQSMTISLGYKGIIEINHKTVEESQFINVGLGIHCKTVISLLTRHGVRFEIAD